MTLPPTQPLGMRLVIHCNKRVSLKTLSICLTESASSSLATAERFFLINSRWWMSLQAQALAMLRVAARPLSQRCTLKRKRMQKYQSLIVLMMTSAFSQFGSHSSTCKERQWAARSQASPGPSNLMQAVLYEPVALHENVWQLARECKEESARIPYR